MFSSSIKHVLIVYRQVCALVSDLKILEDGDESEIGERGVSHPLCYVVCDSSYLNVFMNLGEPVWRPESPCFSGSCSVL